MKKKVLAVVVAALALAGCSAPVAATPPATTEAGHDHGNDEHYPNVPAVSWDAAAEAAAKSTAAKAMALFARPGVEERRWFTDLSPLLAEEYRTEARYILPARIRVSKVLGGPELVREGGNPLTATAVFKTNAGEWSVLLHRTGQTEPWLVQSIRPKDS